MNVIKAILVDDEQRARNVLSNLIKRCDLNIDILAQCSCLEDAVEEIKKLQPDVVFLDVQMPNYAGYEIANFFEEMNFEIIFVTAFDEYAIKAFELSAIDYLVKPIDRKRLIAAVEKLQSKIEKQKKIEDYRTLLNSIKEKEFKQIILPELGNRRIIAINTIIAIEADGSYSKIYTTENKPVTTSKNLKYFENLLPDDASFFRSHRTWVINLKYIEVINKSSLTITLVQNITAKISRTRFSSFENTIR
ncbi:LytTR family two component transcriptional regulator [Aquimarina sp. MAR_2010_214]|uniref:LytR/AlgR family response regulator transcription factor n=1 Tax=Aquimarina sp. MAR_2010_214 TaxID=1250026 RepID=UPI000C713359|nr:response regulator [Aquimarina sp. MAR_2010_214]PKV50326.1 LytTR family two component transcriptional regulator [Aquimarina sp. MAR_2010_214]